MLNWNQFWIELSQHKRFSKEDVRLLYFTLLMISEQPMLYCELSKDMRTVIQFIRSISNGEAHTEAEWEQVQALITLWLPSKKVKNG